MKKYYFLSIILILVCTFSSCTDEFIEEPVTSSTSLNVRFMNSDSLAQLNNSITSLSENITTLQSRVAEALEKIDSLQSLITEFPEDLNLVDWEGQVSILTESNVKSESTRVTAEALRTSLSMKRDSLNTGYFNLLEIDNPVTNKNLLLDTIVTEYPLPLPFNQEMVSYQVTLDELTANITFTYQLKEQLNEVRGKVLVVTDTVLVTQNDFDSLTFTDEGIYIFHF